MKRGLWISFDVMIGVALAAGGFTTTLAAYVLGWKKYKPVVRPAILTAFLGYALVAAGVFLDIGKPWAIWHAIIMWNPHSMLFEVAICVMLYLTVLFLEFSPNLFEGLGMPGAAKVPMVNVRSTPSVGMSTERNSVPLQLAQALRRSK